MNITLPTLADVLSLIAVLDAHPLGSLLLLLLVWSGIVAYWLWKRPKPQ